MSESDGRLRDGLMGIRAGVQIDIRNRESHELTVTALTIQPSDGTDTIRLPVKFQDSRDKCNTKFNRHSLPSTYWFALEVKQ